MLISSIFFLGIVNRIKSIASGRKGPSVLQPFRDVLKLFKKGAVYSETSSLLFRVAPTVAIVAVLTSMLVVPFAGGNAVFSFSGDFVFFAYMLALGRFTMIIAALDTGSSFEGMGANRETLYGLLVEPAFFVMMGVLAMITGLTSFTEIFKAFNTIGDYSLLLGLLFSYLVILIAMVENSRLPVDDPKTHLELTMVHEVMILDNSGFDLGLIHLTTFLKFGLYSMILTNLLVPPTWAIGYQVVCFTAVVAVFSVLVGLLESFRARNKMGKNPPYLLTLTALGLLGLIVALLIIQKIA
jgi:formate hydrogenlyase subunit 4